MRRKVGVPPRVPGSQDVREQGVSRISGVYPEAFAQRVALPT